MGAKNLLILRGPPEHFHEDIAAESLQRPEAI
jgi:hypothetical protein